MASAPYDFIIVGSGIAGLYAALQARQHGSVLIITKGAIDESNTRYAQGGIAAALGPGDTTDRHLADTVEAGAGLVNREMARVLVSEAPDRIRDLAAMGVMFDSDGGGVSLGREAAHSQPRILHAGGDATGAHIELSLSSLAQRSRIKIREHATLASIQVESGRAVDVRIVDRRTAVSNEVAASSVILATGGCGQLYRLTTNPTVATGDGVAVAFRAGAEIEDMEFVQFHPTALCLPGAPAFLISEAVRGEGATLVDGGGRRFMLEYHDRAELAPRDIVARAIQTEMLRAGTDHVYLDITHLASERILARFPQIYQRCLDHGIDITKKPVPVAPAAHYMMGGIRTTEWGETTIDGLFACGECACTGVHGANRLASNSLLETVVFAKRVIERIASGRAQRATASEGTIGLTARDPVEAPCGTLDRLQDLMWEYAGIVRDGAGLTAACQTLATWENRVDDDAERELANLVLCGRLVAEAALVREESRGAHYRMDFPLPREKWRKHTIFRRDD